MRQTFETIFSLGLNDITCVAPPCHTSVSAQELYLPVMHRAVQYVTLSKIPGSFLEFGVHRGYTARCIAQSMRLVDNQEHLYLFDSWEGFPKLEGVDENCPEAINGSWKQGDLVADFPDSWKMIAHYLDMFIPQRVHIMKGFFKDSVPGGLPEKAALVHIDCDLYESTHHVLKNLVEKDVLQQGTVVLFDDFNNGQASNRYGERAAMRDIFPEFRDGAWWNKEKMIGLEPWFTYGTSGYAFLVQKP